MDTQADYGYAEKSEVRGPGAVDALRQNTERLHHQISVLTDRLQPVLGPDRPMEAMIDTPPGTALESEVASVYNAADRIADLVRRVVV